MDVISLQVALKELDLLHASYTVSGNAIIVEHAQKADCSATLWPKAGQWKGSSSLSVLKFNDVETLLSTNLGYSRPARMPFGKHKGERVCEIPTSYLDWVVKNLTLQAPLYKAVAKELRLRKA